MNKPYLNNGNSGRKAKSSSRFNHEKFIQLARNSFKVKKFDRSIDNCRLAVDFALREGNREVAAAAYRIWIKALFELGKFADIKKICCEARSRFGNQLDLIYYEFKAALESGDTDKAARLGSEYIDLHNAADKAQKSPFTESIGKLGEVKRATEEIENKKSKRNVPEETEPKSDL